MYPGVGAHVDPPHHPAPGKKLSLPTPKPPRATDISRIDVRGFEETNLLLQLMVGIGSFQNARLDLLRLLLFQRFLHPHAYLAKSSPVLVLFPAATKVWHRIDLSMLGPALGRASKLTKVTVSIHSETILGYAN